jgi:hypothetical protein
VRTDGGRVLSVPTTRSIGELVRSALRPAGLPEETVHVYLHDTDLLDPRRRASLRAALVALARRRRATDLDALAATLDDVPETPWKAVGRGGGTPGPQ